MSGPSPGADRRAPTSPRSTGALHAPHGERAVAFLVARVTLAAALAAGRAVGAIGVARAAGRLAAVVVAAVGDGAPEVVPAEVGGDAAPRAALHAVGAVRAVTAAIDAD